MKFLIAFVLAFATVSAKDFYSRSSEIPVLEKEGRLTNGQNAAPGQFYYQVGLFLKMRTNSHWCGDSFIRNNWILTAADCVEGVSCSAVYLGATQRLAAEKIHNVAKNDIIIHSYKERHSSDNYIFLIRIPTTSESGRIGIVRFPSKHDNNNYFGYIVVIFGWGYINDSTIRILIEFYNGEFSDNTFALLLRIGCLAAMLILAVHWCWMDKIFKSVWLHSVLKRAELKDFQLLTQMLVLI